MTITAIGTGSKSFVYPLRNPRIAGVLSSSDLDYVKYLFSRADAKLRKEALQYLAIRLERGAAVTRRQRAEILVLTKEAVGSLDWPTAHSMRLWTYILACHTRDPRAAPLLWRAAAAEEETYLVVWACAAVCLSTPPVCPCYGEANGPEYRQLVLIGQHATRRGLEVGASFALAMGILGTGKYLVDNVQGTIGEAEVNAHYVQWLLLGLGRDEITFASPKDKRRLMTFVEGDCLGHDNNQVAEYGFWAIYRQGRGHELPVDVKDRVRRWTDENVRRWAYRAFAKDSASKVKNLDFLMQQVRREEDHQVARSGVAAALINKAGRDYDDYDTGLMVECRDLIIDWHGREAVGAIRSKLTDYLVSISESDELIREYMFAILDGEADREVVELVRRRQRRAPSLAARLSQSNATADLFAPVVHIVEPVGARETQSLPQRQEVIAAQARPRPSRPEAPRVLIVTALAKEGAAVQATFDTCGDPESRADDPNIYRVGSFFIGGDSSRPRHVRLVTQASTGEENATAVTVHALRSFPEVEHVLMVGIAGGCPDPEHPEQHVRLGDIVVSNSSGIVDYANVKITENDIQHRSPPREPGRRLLAAHNDLDTRAMLGRRPWEQYHAAALANFPPEEGFSRPNDLADELKNAKGEKLDHPDDPMRRPGKPRVHGGAIGTANILVKNATLRDYLRDKFHVRALEMEASGIQNAAFASSKDVLVIRGICDYADAWKNDTWQRYAALAAAAYARALIETLPEEWFLRL